MWHFNRWQMVYHGTWQALVHASSKAPCALAKRLVTCAVVLDGKRLQMSTGETEQEHILALEQGELMINWEHHRAGLGQAVEITSGAD